MRSSLTARRCEDRVWRRVVSKSVNVNMTSAGSARWAPAQKHMERTRAFVEVGQFGGRFVGRYVRADTDWASHRPCDRTHGQVFDVPERQSVDVRIEMRMSETSRVETQPEDLLGHEFCTAVHGCGWSGSKV